MTPLEAIFSDYMQVSYGTTTTLLYYFVIFKAYLKNIENIVLNHDQQQPEISWLHVVFFKDVFSL